jgi:hypothetical protein
MCSYNGQLFLAEQLESLQRQTHSNSAAYVFDDGSQDETLNLLQSSIQWGAEWLQIIEGPRCGFVAVANFLSLTCRADIKADFYARADQDDVWKQRALNWLAAVPKRIPALYCGRTELICAQEAFRFLHVSTDEVYSSLAKDEPAFNESHQHEPNSPYSASKALPMYGDGQQIGDWLFVNHCSAIRRVPEAGTGSEVYNVGGWNEKPNLDIMHTVRALLDEPRPRTDGQDYNAQITYLTDRPGHDRRYAIDARKRERERGWKPAETFETGIRETVQWSLDNQDWVSNIPSGAYRGWVEKNYAERTA